MVDYATLVWLLFQFESECLHNIAEWRSGLSRRSHKPENAGSNPCLTQQSRVSVVGQHVRFISSNDWFDSSTLDVSADVKGIWYTFLSQKEESVSSSLTIGTIMLSWLSG